MVETVKFGFDFNFVFQPLLPSSHLASALQLKGFSCANMPSAVSAPLTLYDKVLRDHIVDEKEDGTILLYIGMQTL